MVVEKEDLGARAEVVGVPHAEVVDHCGDLGHLASRTREAGREVGEIRGCKHWRKSDWSWSRLRR